MKAIRNVPFSVTDYIGRLRSLLSGAAGSDEALTSIKNAMVQRAAVRCNTTPENILKVPKRMLANYLMMDSEAMGLRLEELKRGSDIELIANDVRMLRVAVRKGDQYLDGSTRDNEIESIDDTARRVFEKLARAFPEKKLDESIEYQNRGAPRVASA